MKALNFLVPLVAIALFTLAACGDDNGTGDTTGTNCSLEARSSVTVKVVDAAGAAVTDATVTFSVDGAAAQNCELFPVGSDYVCGYEIEGDFTITVTKGADTKTQNVTVGKTADGCHVEGKTITITLGA